MRAWQAWVRFQIAYKIIHVLNEEARLLMFVTFQHWRRLACVSLSKRRRAARMAMKKYALIQQVGIQSAAARALWRLPGGESICLQKQ
jgi:hypothetical protein